MVDLNHIFLFLAVVSPLAVLARSWRYHAGDEGWRVAAIVVLAVTAIAWLIVRDQAGFIGLGAWFALLLLPAVGLKKMTELAANHDYRSAGKLAVFLRWLHPTKNLRGQIQMFRHFEARQRAGALPPAMEVHPSLRRDRRRLRGAPVVVSLILVNVFVFLVELRRGLTDQDLEGRVLFGLGALRPFQVLFGHEYWRLVAALFLHAGWAHLLFNLFALYVIGPGFERAIGSVRFIACYLLSGICSTTGIVMLYRLGIVRDVVDRQGHVHYLEVVGASGCVMGIVGAWAAFLIRDHRTPQVRRRLMNIVTIVVIQTMFDLTTPQVSMSAHLCGLIGGFLVGLALASGNPKTNLERRPSYG